MFAIRMDVITQWRTLNRDHCGLSIILFLYSEKYLNEEKRIMHCRFFIVWFGNMFAIYLEIKIILYFDTCYCSRYTTIQLTTNKIIKNNALNQQTFLFGPLETRYHCSDKNNVFRILRLY